MLCLAAYLIRFPPIRLHPLYWTHPVSTGSFKIFLYSSQITGTTGSPGTTSIKIKRSFSYVSSGKSGKIAFSKSAAPIPSARMTRFPVVSDGKFAFARTIFKHSAKISSSVHSNSTSNLIYRHLCKTKQLFCPCNTF